MEKSCWVATAQASYQEAEAAIKLMMGIKVGHSTLQRLVQRSEFPEGEAPKTVRALSADGGKVRLRTEELGVSCQWRDYKAVSLHDSVCAAYFQENDALIDWVKRQPLTSSLITCLGDGHDGVWNLIAQINSEDERREVLDWFHLVENLHKVGGSLKRLRRIETSLWHGLIDEAVDELATCRGRPRHVQRFLDYLLKHRHRIINYDLAQAAGIPIGSGSVESTIKRIGSRLKLSGAQWLPSSVSQILRLRCAYLNGAFF